MRNFRELKVWQKAHSLTIAVYQSTTDFPFEERNGLRSQIRRAASSMGANIAEGSGKESNADFCRFLQIALGSATELENHLLLASDLGYLKPASDRNLLDETIELKKMLTRFIQYLNCGSRKTRRA